MMYFIIVDFKRYEDCVDVMDPVQSKLHISTTFVANVYYAWWIDFTDFIFDTVYCQA